MRYLLFAIAVLFFVCYVGPQIFAGIAIILCGLLDFSADTSVVLALLLTAGILIFGLLKGPKQS